MSYISAETSSSGVSVDDILHLVTGDESHEYIELEVYVTFGCGQVQSGSFLDIAAPSGLLDLGMGKISVPGILSRESYIADSFSLCFGHDGLGRTNFGDKGSPDQDETYFNPNPSNYNVTVTQIQIGETQLDMNVAALFNSRTSFMCLTDPAYTRLSERFHSRVQYTISDAFMTGESLLVYCYHMSPGGNANFVPSMSLTTKGGDQSAVHDHANDFKYMFYEVRLTRQFNSFPPFLGRKLTYCLTIVKDAEVNIIGQNFMTGCRLMLDCERLVLGRKKFDCPCSWISRFIKTFQHRRSNEPSYLQDCNRVTDS